MPVDKDGTATSEAVGAPARMLRINLQLREKVASMESEIVLMREQIEEFRRNPPEPKGGKKHLSSKLLQELETRAHEAESQVEQLQTEKDELITELDQVKKELAQAEERIQSLTDERTALRFQLEEQLQNMAEQDEAAAP